MGRKIWNVAKKIIFIWGALTLALVAYALFVAYIPPLFKSHKQTKTETPSEQVVFEKKEGGYKLLVKRKETQGADEYLVTLSRDGKPVVQNYRLPTQKYHLEYINIYDASFVALRGNEQGLVLYSAYSDDEGASDSHIWFLKATDTMSVREVISLSDVHLAESGGLTILGNRRIGLPYQEGFRSEPFIVPVAVHVNDTIAISPLLNREGADMLFSVLKQEVKAREDKKPKDKANELAEGYRNASKEMSEALIEKTIPF